MGDRRAIGGADGDTIGAVLMIAAGVALLALILLSASRSAAGRTRALESDAIDEPDGGDPNHEDGGEVR